MPSKIPAVFNWSGGKDSALALYRTLQENQYQIIALLTTINRETQRSSMHGIPVELLHQQAQSIGLPLQVVELPANSSLETYETAMTEAITSFTAAGIRHFIFGDICLQEVREYREKLLTPHGIQVVEPLWCDDTRAIAQAFLDSGLQTVITTTDAALLDERFVGQQYNRHFLDSLPPEVDPCGENGEFHTFCYAGGMFRYPVAFSMGRPQRISYPAKMADSSVKTFTYCYVDLALPDHKSPMTERI